MTNKIEAQEGYVFAKNDRTEVYGRIMYLGINDSENNYIQITTEEAAELKAKIEEDSEKQLQLKKEEMQKLEENQREQ